MSDSVKFTYKDEIDTLFVNDNGKIKSYKMDTIHNQQDKIFKYIIKSISELDGDEPEPGSYVYEFDIFPISAIYEGWMEYITSGEFIPMVEGDRYNIELDGVLYSNVEVSSMTDPSSGETGYSLGNLSLLILRSILGMFTPVEIKQSVVDNGLPFYFDGTSGIIGFASKPQNHTMIVTSVSDPSSSYTVEISSSDLQDMGAIYSLPETNESIIEKLGIADGTPQDIIVGDNTYSGAWRSVSEDGETGFDFVMPGYDNPNEQPFMSTIRVQQSELSYNMFGSALISNRTPVKIPKSEV